METNLRSVVVWWYNTRPMRTFCDQMREGVCLVIDKTCGGNSHVLFIKDVRFVDLKYEGPMLCIHTYLASRTAQRPPGS